jgi:F-type H+-transporting ATPase subunit gamma
MASTRDIRRRIKSVKNTRQITKAMELVAASKMKKAQQAALAGRPYAELLAQMLAALADRVEEAQHAFLVRREVKTRGIILITSDKGLCGPLNSNVFKLVTDIKTPAKYAVIGRKGAQFIARTRRQLLADFPANDRVAFSDIRVVAEFMTKQYLEGAVDTVEVIWPRLRNTLVQVATVLPLLPLSSVKEAVEELRAESGTVSVPKGTLECQMIFESSAETVLAALLPLYVNRQVFHQALDAKASEHSARMVAMKTAKDNATKLLGDLTLEYNKARQAGITQEILEIAAAQFSAA